ncbi:MAG TPA: hypothetical protein VGW14_01580 [Thermoleophilaceae bacterium]|nr:hypothetical protein [Thermoleophilaceae bacterium]
MSGTVRIALFAALLALVFGGAAMAGSALDPDPDAEEAHGAEDHTGGHEAARAPAGLALAEDGLRVDVDRLRLAAGRPERLGFRIVGEAGRTVRDFDVEHDRRMHLIVVRRDLTGFQHLHPEIALDGTWSTSLELTEPGSYRVFADFKSGGASHTLGADVHVAGPFEPRDLPHPSDRAGTGDGYEVRLTEDDGRLRFTVYLGDRRVDDIEPYLGARGHMVALREGDLAFLHVHPESEATEGGDIRFRVEFPSAGRYRLFLPFKHDGRVRTVAFTEETGVEHGH